MKEIEKKQEELKCEEIELLRTGMSDNANLLSDDELSEIFGGYEQCPGIFCKGYETSDGKCKTYCQPNYLKD